VTGVQTCALPISIVGPFGASFPIGDCADVIRSDKERKLELRTSRRDCLKHNDQSSEFNPGIEIVGFEAGQLTLSHVKTSSVTVRVMRRRTPTQEQRRLCTGGPPDFEGRASILSVGEFRSFIAPDEWQETPCKPSGDYKNECACAQTEIQIPKSAIESDGSPRLTVPFRGSGFDAAYLYYWPTDIAKVINMGEFEKDGQKKLRLMVVGSGMAPTDFKADPCMSGDCKEPGARPNPGWTVDAGGLKLTEKAGEVTAEGSVMTVEGPADQLGKAKTLIVRQKHLPRPVELKGPGSTPSPAKPKITSAAEVLVESAGAIAFRGQSLSAVESVSFEDNKLEFTVATRSDPSDSKKKITELLVFLTRKVTAKPGMVTLLVRSKAGNSVPAQLIVNPRT